MKSVGRLAFKLWLCAAFAQGLVFLAFFNNLVGMRTAGIDQQLRTMVARVVGPASARAALGLPLEYQTNLQPLLDQLAQVAKGQGDIFIVKPDRSIAFSSERSMIGSQVPPQWMKPANTQGGEWQFSTPRELGIGAAISSPVFTDAGSVIARSTTTDLTVDAVSDLRSPVLTAFGFLALVGILAVMGTILASRVLSVKLAAIAAAYRSASTKIHDGKALEDGPATPGLEAVRGILTVFATTEDEAMQTDHVSPKVSGTVAAANSEAPL